MSATTLGSVGAATLLGTGTYLTTDDLTRIQSGGTVLEFLDLPLTAGQSEAAALAAYGSAGFTLANTAQVTALFDAFGIVYSFAPGTFVDLGAAPVNAANFVTYLGETFNVAGPASVANFDSSGFGGGARSYFCIATSSDTCNPTSFVNNFDFTPYPIIGFALVRSDSIAATPLPAALPLFAGGLGALGLVGWRRKKKKAAALAA